MGRSEQEAELARILANVQGTERKRLRAALGNPPNLENVPADFWTGYSNALKQQVIPALEKIFMASAEAMLTATPSLGVDWTLVNKQASEWASRYGFDLVKDLTATTRTALQEKVAGFYENQLTIAQFTESLEPLFGPVRAEMIAVTETTRAAVQGQAALVNELNRTGIVMEPFFITSEDETVCPICSPLNGKKVSEADFPPLHPRCRCDIAYKNSDAGKDESEGAAVREHPVSEALSLPGGAVGDSARRALDDINAVHDDGALPHIPLKSSNASSRFGAYRAYYDGRPVEINISRGGDHRELTTAHEIGHFLDHHGIGTPGTWSSESDPMLAGWRDSVVNSEGVKNWLGIRKMGKVPNIIGGQDYPADKKYLGYMLSTKELWARSYSQYIATKSGDRVMLDQLKKLQPGGGNPYAPQWADADFIPILNAIDDAFKKMGWIP